MDKSPTPNLEKNNNPGNQSVQNYEQESLTPYSSRPKKILIITVVVILVLLVFVVFFLFVKINSSDYGTLNSETVNQEITEESSDVVSYEVLPSIAAPPLKLSKDVSASDFERIFSSKTLTDQELFGISVLTHFDGRPLYSAREKHSRINHLFLGTEKLFTTIDNVTSYNDDFEGELYVLTWEIGDVDKSLYDYNGKRSYTYQDSILNIVRLENGELDIITGEREKIKPKVNIEADENYNVTISVTGGIDCSGSSYRPLDYDYDPEIDPEGTIWTTFVCDGLELNEDFVIVPQSMEAFPTVEPLLWVGSKKSEVDEYYNRIKTIRNKINEIMEKTEELAIGFENEEISEEAFTRKIYALDAEYKSHEHELKLLDIPKKYVLMDGAVSSGPYHAIQEIHILDEKLFYTGLTSKGWVAIYDEVQVSEPYDSALITDARIDDGHLVFEMTDLNGEFDMDRMRRGGSVDSRDIIVDGQLVSQSTSREHTINSRNFLMIGDIPAYIVENQENATSYLVYGESEIHFPEQQIRQIYDNGGRVVVNTGESIYIEKN